MSEKRKIIITGGAGFIGSQLGYELVKQGWDVVLLDNLWAGNLDNLVIDGKTFGTFLAKDIRGTDLASYIRGAEIVFHLAGIAALPVCESRPQFAYDVNTSGTANVLEAARLAGVRRVLFSSTSAVYECSPGECHKENDPVAPNLVYACSKVSAEAMCRAFAANYGMDIIIARFFNVYGPHQDVRRQSPPFTSYIARELHAGRSPILYNNSDVKRDYVHAADVIRLLIKMIDAGRKYPGEIFNVGSGTGYSVPDLYQRMCRVAGKQIAPIYKHPEAIWDNYESLFLPPYPLSRKRVGEEVHKHAIADTSKTEREFTWKAEVDIDKGLSSVYEFTSLQN